MSFEHVPDWMRGLEAVQRARDAYLESRGIDLDQLPEPVRFCACDNEVYVAGDKHCAQCIVQSYDHYCPDCGVYVRPRDRCDCQ